MRSAVYHPLKGYIVSLQVNSLLPSQNLHVQHVCAINGSGAINIKKNDASICNAWVSQGSGWDISSCSAVTQLVPGSKVKVTGDNRYPAEITASHNGFNGILIYAD